MSSTARESEAGRRPNVELMRVIAAVMVITIHATSTAVIDGERNAGFGATYWIALVAHEASRAGVPVFFAITGWLLLRRPHPGDGEWLATRVRRIMVLLTIWSAIYVVDALLVASAIGRDLWTEPEGPVPWLIAELTLFLAGSGTREHLWYLYFAWALTLAIWLVRAAPSEVHRVGYGVAAALLIVPIGIAAGFNIRVSWESFGWSLGYAALGYLLLETRPRRAIAIAAYVVGTVAIVVLTVLIGFNRWPAAYPSPFVVLATLGLIWFVASLRIPASLVSAVQRLGALTLGVYLMHPLVLDVLRLAARPGGALADVSPLTRLGITWTCTIAVTFAAVAAWHRVPLLKRALG